MDLSHLVQSEKTVSCLLVGPSLIWCRATFNNFNDSALQLKKWVQVEIELFTKLKPQETDLEEDEGSPALELSSIMVMFNEKGLNFTQPA